MTSTIKDILNKYAKLEALYTTAQNKVELNNFMYTRAPSEKQVAAMYINFAATWGLTGKNCFTLANNLALSLLVTDPPKDFLVKFPYHSFVIDLPNGLIAGLQQICVTDLVDNTENPEVILICETDYGMVLHKQFPVSDFNVYESPSIPPVGSLHLNKKDKHVLKLAHRLAYNFMLWLTALNPVMEKTKIEKAKTTKQLKAIKCIPIEWTLGNNVELKPALAKFIQDYVIIGTADPVEIKNISHQFMVRGHFCKQAVGPKWTLRRLIWKEPHVRGPADAPAIAHVYQALPAKNSTPQSPLTLT